MAILVFLQHTDGKLPKSTLAAIAAAQALASAWNKGELVGVALGAGAKSAAADAGAYGVAKVAVSEQPIFARFVAPHFAAAVAKAGKDFGADTVVCAATSTGKDLAARLAGVLDAGQASDVIAINSDGTLKRPMYAGNAFADVEITTAQRVVTVRPTAFAAAAKGAGAAAVQELAVDVSSQGEVLSYEMQKGERPELGDAAVVVSGGRALGSAENFEKVLFPLADALGAAVGASRAAVDSGYAPNDWQVGQTGKVVAPNLYIAAGISGAIQHLAGMKDSKVVVAINKDPEAPIFETADFGLVADLFQAVPALTEAIKKVKGA